MKRKILGAILVFFLAVGTIGTMHIGDEKDEAMKNGPIKSTNILEIEFIC